MRRLSWTLVDAAMAVALVFWGRKWLYQLTLKGVAERVEVSGQQTVNKSSESHAIFTVAIREKEAEFREELDIPQKAREISNPRKARQ